MKKTKYSRALRHALFATSAMTIAAVAALPAKAALVADGYLETDYQLGYSLGFLDDSGNAIGDGKLYFGLANDGSLFLYFQMPLNYVDNTYGSNAASDWGKKGHSFNDLLGSDSLGSTKKGSSPFAFKGNEIVIDYIAGVGCDKKSGTCTDYRSGGPGSPLDDGATSNSEGAIISGNVSEILEIATSLEYNFDMFGVQATNSLDDPNWVKEVGYEIKFAAGTFDPVQWLNPTIAPTLVNLGSPHVSPSKKAFGDYGELTCLKGCTIPTPEPGTMSLMGAALAGLGLTALRKRRRKRS